MQDKGVGGVEGGGIQRSSLRVPFIGALSKIENRMPQPGREGFFPPR